MIDPVSIGIAFAVAQKSVGYIKQAIALGKDVIVYTVNLQGSLKIVMSFILQALRYRQVN